MSRSRRREPRRSAVSSTVIFAVVCVTSLAIAGGYGAMARRRADSAAGPRWYP